MKITTTYKVEPNHMDPTRGQLTIQVRVNGVPSQSIVHLSGPLADIEQFVAGKIDDDEISRRWGMKKA